MSVSINEIAKRAGVSSLTVARILRGDVCESQPQNATKAKSIRRIAADGCRPNGLTRAVSCGRTHRIGLLYTDDAWISADINANVVNSLLALVSKAGAIISSYVRSMKAVLGKKLFWEVRLTGALSSKLYRLMLPMRFKGEICRWCSWATTTIHGYPKFSSMILRGPMLPRSTCSAWAIHE